MARQFVVQVGNRPGEIAHLFRLLAMHGVNIEHVAGVAAVASGSVALSVNDDAATREALRDAGYAFVEGESLVIRVEDVPGTLAQTTEALAAAGVNVLSVLEVGRHGGSVDLAFIVDDLGKARAAVVDAEGDVVSWPGGD